MKSRIAHCLNNTKAKKIYLDLLGTLKEDDLKPHVFVSKMMEIYHSYVFTLAKKPDRSTHGLYFEYVIGETLAMNGVQHMYYQAVIEHVPLAVFDWFLYHRKYPISISCKTKARDRWKQAAHEGAALKQVYSQSTNFLITLEKVSKADEKKNKHPEQLTIL